MTIKQRAPGFSKEPATTRARRRLEPTRYARIFSIARRLLRGETIEFTDQHGRQWRGTASTLSLVQAADGKGGSLLEGANAYDVAVELAAADGFDR